MSFRRKRRSDNDDYYQPYQKKFRLPPMIELAKTLCGDLNTLGEHPKRYVEDVEFMSLPIVTNFENEEDFRQAVLNTLYGVITEQPQKTLHIAGLIQAVNTKNGAIGKMILEFFHQKAQELFQEAVKKDIEPASSETGPWNKLKLILRLFASLSAMIDESSLIEVLTQFFKLAISLQQSTPNSRNPLGEAVYYNTLISLPYALQFDKSNEKLLDGLKALIELAHEFVIVETEISITKPFDSKVQPYESKQIVQLILPAVDEYLQKVDGENIFPPLGESLSELIQSTEKHNLPLFAVPSLEELSDFTGLDNGLGSVDGMWRTPRLTFEIYLPTNGFATTPSYESYTGLLTRDIATDIIEALEFNRKEVSRQIITLDLFFKEGLFAPPKSTIDDLKRLVESNQDSDNKLSTWKIEDVAVETVLSLIYKLPTASQPFVYFYTTLVEACTNASAAIAPVMGRAIRFFYSNLHHLDFELRSRYLDWLTVQLSNFNFTWKWREWENDSLRFGGSDYHPKIVFIKNLISKELRLSTEEKIESTLTEEFHKYLNCSLFDDDYIKKYYSELSSEVELETNDGFFFLNEKIPFKATVTKIIEILQKSSESTQMEELNNAIAQLKDEIKDVENSDKLLVSVFFQTVAFVGNRSISHAGRYIGSTCKILKQLVDVTDDENDDGTGDEEMKDQTTADSDVSSKKQSWAIEAILSYWNHDPQSGYLVLDILQSFGVISSIAVIKSALKDDRKRNLGLVDVSTIESILRSLTRLVFSGLGKDELQIVFKELCCILSTNVETLKIEGCIELPDVNGEITEQVELIWKYHAVMGFIRTVLRKFSDEYSSFQEDIEMILLNEVKHDSSKEIISKWISELKIL